MILLPPNAVVDLDAYRRNRSERAREATSPRPVTTPLDPRQFDVSAIRRDLAEQDFDGPAAA